MKTNKLNQIRKHAEVNAVFGDAENISTIKRQMKLDNTLNKVDNLSTADVITKVLNDYRFLFNRLPKHIKGIAKKMFCNAIRIIITNNGAMFALNNKGEIDSDKVIDKLNKKDNKDLFILLSNLIQDAAKDVDTTIKIDSAVETMTELLNEYKKVA